MFVLVDRGDGDRGDGVFDSDSPIRVIRSTFRWILLFGSFGQLPPFGQWVFDKSRVRFCGGG